MRRRTLRISAAAAASACRAAQSREWLLYVGTYTNRDSKGIYAWRFDASGKMTPLGVAAETRNPSFLAIDSGGRFLYAVNENNRGTVSAFSIDHASARLQLLNSVSTKGAGPCHLALDHTERWLATVNYESGSVAVFPIEAPGSLGAASSFEQHSGSSVNPQRQAGPHAHMAAFTPDNRFLLIPDLGLDRVMVYRFDAGSGTITPDNSAYLKTAAGFGPRHLAFIGNARFLYVLGEMAASVAVFRFDVGKGTGEEIQSISMLPESYNGAKGGAEIAIDPTGNFLYASNRGHDSIAVFRIDRTAGTLRSEAQIPARGKTPRNSPSIRPAVSYWRPARIRTASLFFEPMPRADSSPRRVSRWKRLHPSALRSPLRDSTLQWPNRGNRTSIR
jgi:6-phosphogluconolactonase